MKKNYTLRYLIVGAILVAVMLLSLGWGTYEISAPDIIKTFFGYGSKFQNTVIFTLRLPRIAVAVLVGTALAVSACILQSVTKNDLAEPGIIGINAGAALTVVIIISHGTLYYNEISKVRMYLMPLGAVVGAFAAAAIVYLLAMRKGKAAPVRLILVGIGVNAGINALVTFYQLNMSGGDYNRALTWISGSLWGSSWTYFWLVGPWILLLCGLTIYRGKVLDVMDLGDELATGLGVNVEKNRKTLMFFAVGLAALATAVAGNIAFLGLLGPHIAKSIVGPVHSRKIPMAAMISSAIIIAADACARNLFSPIEIPVGVMISLVGVPYFIYLMLKK